MKRILAYMDFMCPSGFGTVAHNVWDRLTPWLIENDIYVDVAALNYAGSPTLQYNDRIIVWDPGIFARNQDDAHYRDGVLNMAIEGNYDAIWMMNDVPVLGPMVRFLRQLNERRKLEGGKIFKVVLYTPIDSVPFTRYFTDLDFYDKVLTYTKYGKAELENAFWRENGRPIQVGVIGHGVNRTDFYPLPDTQKLKEKFDFPKGSFVFGHINKNQPRKDMGGTIIAFAQFKEWQRNSKYKDIPAILYLHCDPQEKNGINIYVAVERLGLQIGKDVQIPLLEKYKGSGYDKKELNELYNSIDCFVTTTTAEGWGLTVTEAMSVGLPVICGVHTSLSEITDNGSLVYGCTNLIPFIQNEDGENVRWKLHPSEVADKMIQSFIDVVDNGKARIDYTAKLDQYSWDEIARDWEKVFESIGLV